MKKERKFGLKEFPRLLVYKIGGSGSAWVTVLVIGVFFIVLCGVLVVKDRKVYRKLYH